MKEIITFGDWVIDQDGITWTTHDDYFINKNRLWETRNCDDNILCWDWFIHLAEKKQITLENVNDLNCAFVFAMDYFKELKPKGIDASLAHTILLQKEILNQRKNRVNI